MYRFASNLASKARVANNSSHQAGRLSWSRNYAMKDNEARETMRKGVEELANAVRGSMGPKGHNVVIEQSYGVPKVTKNGVTMAKSVEFQGKVKNVGASLVNQAANATNDMAGDCTLFTRAKFPNGCKSVPARMNAMGPRCGINMARMISTSDQIAQVTVSKDETVILNAADDKKSLDERCEQIMSSIESSTSDYDKGKLQEMLAKLSGDVPMLMAGGASDTELSEKKDRITDALNASKAAVKEGIVPGGGVALLYASKDLKNLTANFHQKIGVGIMPNALQMPVRAITSNAGVEGEPNIRNTLRPLSPHLPVYQPQLSSTLSIFHRITGAFLSTMVLSFYFLSMKMGLICFTYETFYQFIFYLSKLTLISTEICALALSYHLFNGIRHLLTDYSGFLFFGKRSRGH